MLVLDDVRCTIPTGHLLNHACEALDAQRLGDAHFVIDTALVSTEWAAASVRHRVWVETGSTAWEPGCGGSAVTTRPICGS